MTSKKFFEHHSSLFVTLSSAAFVVDVDVGDDSTLTLKKAFLVQLLVTVSFFFERKNGAAQKLLKSLTEGRWQQRRRRRRRRRHRRRSRSLTCRSELE